MWNFRKPIRDDAQNLFNPILCSFVSKLSACIKRQKFIVIIAMPTCGEIVQLDEKLLKLTTQGILSYLCPLDLWKSFFQLIVSRFIILQYFFNRFFQNVERTEIATMQYKLEKLHGQECNISWYYTLPREVSMQTKRGISQLI